MNPIRPVGQREAVPEPERYCGRPAMVAALIVAVAAVSLVPQYRSTEERCRDFDVETEVMLLDTRAACEQEGAMKGKVGIAEKEFNGLNDRHKEAMNEYKICQKRFRGDRQACYEPREMLNEAETKAKAAETRYYKMRASAELAERVCRDRAAKYESRIRSRPQVCKAFR